MVICTDPGHGGSDTGASYGGVHEKDINLQSTLIFNEMLKKMNYRVFTTRTNDFDVPPLGVRTRLVNAHHSQQKPGFDAIVSIHCNAAGRQDPETDTYVPLTNIRGLYVIYSCESSKGTTLARTIKNSCESQNITLSHKGMVSTVQLGRSLAWIHKTLPPAVLIELGFLTCPQERALLQNETYRSKVIGAIAEGIHEYGKNS